jgi:hypothetical protein
MAAVRLVDGGSDGVRHICHLLPAQAEHIRRLPFYIFLAFMTWLRNE